MTVEIRLDPATRAPVDENSVAFLRRMASLVPGVIYVFNHKTQSNEYSNRSIAELLKYTPQELIDMGDSIIETIVHKDDLPGLVAYFDRIAEVPDGEYTSFEYRDYAKDGSIVWLRSIDTPFERNADGSVLRHLGIAFDITVEKTAELELRRLNAELEARVTDRTQALSELNEKLEARVRSRTQALRDANRELEQLSYIATHDLKVPVHNMMGLAALLRNGGPELMPEQAETLDLMEQVCAQALSKLEALVTVAQGNTLRRCAPEPVDLQASLDKVCAALAPRIAAEEAVITADFKASEVMFQRVEVENILRVLLENALDYRAADRAPVIELASSAGADGVSLSLRDNGTGLDLPCDQDKVFGLFQRAHVVPDRAGVSLHAVRRLLQHNGGRIEVAGALEEGCTFTVHFPAAAQAEPA